jgi:hypothetical protein
MQILQTQPFIDNCPDVTVLETPQTQIPTYRETRYRSTTHWLSRYTMDINFQTTEQVDNWRGNIP